VHFVDNNDLVSALGREKTDIFLQFPDLLDTSVRSAVNFMDVNCIAERDLPAMFTLVAGSFCRTFLTIESLGNQPGKGCLTYTPDTAENKGMGYTVPVNGILQRPDNRLLPDNFFKCLGSPLSC
jgi:hypothetical protein